MKLSRKCFLKTVGMVAATMAFGQMGPSVLASDTTGIRASSGMCITEVIDLKGMTRLEQKKIMEERGIYYDPTIEYEKIVVEVPVSRVSTDFQYQFQTTYGNKPVVTEQASVLDATAAAILDAGVNIIIGLNKPYIWIPYTASGLSPSQFFIYTDPNQYASTSIYTHVTTKQCDIYSEEDGEWQSNAFVQKADIEETTVMYALVDPETKRYTSETSKKTEQRETENYSNESYIVDKAYYCFIHNLPSYYEVI